MQPFLIIFLVTVSTGITYAATPTIADELTALSAVIEELKEEEKVVNKQYHDEISDHIEQNIQKIGETIKTAVTNFNKTKDISVIAKAKDDFVSILTSTITQVKQLKDQLKMVKAEAWEENKDNVKQSIIDLAAVVAAAREELVTTAVASPKDLNAAVARLNGSASWQTASWLLMVLAVCLSLSIGIVLFTKLKVRPNASGRVRGYTPLGGSSAGGVFVPTNQRE